MLSRSLAIAGLAMVAALAALPANAGSPARCVDPCVVDAVAALMVYRPYVLPRVCIVDQGPVYSGPGIYTDPTVVVPRPMPRYPYVAHDYPAYHGHYYSPRGRGYR